eukprot:TRINITY_DN21775_c0_g1_i1.p1 TRINITY_DN21775_c0_g1~~TRINITY_DN21775_c0_g1_i1.p1  ORF type:complete len:515 (+),score=119.03 TRINITY_DN21775_c0_g1_i1:22-1566(+)
MTGRAMARPFSCVARRPAAGVTSRHLSGLAWSRCHAELPAAPTPTPTPAAARQRPRHWPQEQSRGAAAAAASQVSLRQWRAGGRTASGARHYSSAYADGLIDYWAEQKPQGVSLGDLCEIGLDRRKRREHGAFLHKELRIRFAQRVAELRSLPYGMSTRPGIRDVIGWYTGFVVDLEDEEPPLSASQDQAFTDVLNRIFEEHAEVIQAMAFGVQDLMAELGSDYEAVQPQVDSILRRFFMARIGLRFLLQHHIESYRNRNGHSGILQLECSPAEIARKAAKDSKALCQLHMGQAPDVIIEESVPGTFTYVPMHLHYMLTEVFKNACRAVTERHADGGFDDLLPPVRCSIVHGYEDVTLRISDQGGGISRSRLEDVFKFMYSTYKHSPWADIRRKQARPQFGDSASNPLQRQKPTGVLAGYGVGLTLSRLYAQYFGGDLKIMSLDGYGTDVYLHLSRLGTRGEELPKVVLHSPSMRDSSALDDSLLTRGRLLISADEEAWLRRELQRIRSEAAAP